MKKNGKVWKVVPASAEGKANDASTPYGKLFKAGRLMYLWINKPSGFIGGGVLKYSKRIQPNKGDVIELGGRRLAVLSVDSLNRQMPDVYCTEASADKLAKKATTLQEFEAFLMDMRMKKGWVVTLEYPSVWCATVHHKVTGKKLGETGSTSLEALVHFMKTIPIEDWG